MNLLEDYLATVTEPTMQLVKKSVLKCFDDALTYNDAVVKETKEILERCAERYAKSGKTTSDKRQLNLAIAIGNGLLAQHILTTEIQKNVNLQNILHGLLDILTDSAFKTLMKAIKIPVP